MCTVCINSVFGIFFSISTRNYKKAIAKNRRARYDCMKTTCHDFTRMATGAPIVAMPAICTLFASHFPSTPESR